MLLETGLKELYEIKKKIKKKKERGRSVFLPETAPLLFTFVACIATQPNKAKLQYQAQPMSKSGTVFGESVNPLL